MKGEYTSAAEGGKRRRREDMKDIVRREKLKSAYWRDTDVNCSREN